MCSGEGQPRKTHYLSLGVRLPFEEGFPFGEDGSSTVNPALIVITSEQID